MQSCWNCQWINAAPRHVMTFAFRWLGQIVMTDEMNFGVIAEGRFAAAYLLEDDPGLTMVRDRWKPLDVSLDILRCYRMTISSMSSVIRI